MTRKYLVQFCDVAGLKSKNEKKRYDLSHGAALTVAFSIFPLSLLLQHDFKTISNAWVTRLRYCSGVFNITYGPCFNLVQQSSTVLNIVAKYHCNVIVTSVYAKCLIFRIIPTHAVFADSRLPVSESNALIKKRIQNSWPVGKFIEVELFDVWNFIIISSSCAKNLTSVSPT